MLGDPLASALGGHQHLVKQRVRALECLQRRWGLNVMLAAELVLGMMLIFGVRQIRLRVCATISILIKQFLNPPRCKYYEHLDGVKI